MTLSRPRFNFGAKQKSELQNFVPEGHPKLHVPILTLCTPESNSWKLGHTDFVLYCVKKWYWQPKGTNQKGQITIDSTIIAISLSRLMWSTPVKISSRDFATVKSLTVCTPLKTSGKSFAFDKRKTKQKRNSPQSVNSFVAQYSSRCFLVPVLYLLPSLFFLFCYCFHHRYHPEIHLQHSQFYYPSQC